MPHNIAPWFDNSDLVACGAEATRHGVVEAIFEAKGTRFVTPGSPEQPARGLDRRLHRVPAVYQSGDECSLGLGLAFAAHRSVDESGPPPNQVHGWDEGA